MKTTFLRRGLAAVLFVTVGLGLALAPRAAWATEATVHHRLAVTLDPETAGLTVTDTITLPAALRTPQTLIKLNTALTPTVDDPTLSLTLVEENAPAKDVGIDRDNDDPRASVRVNVYRLDGLPATGEVAFTLSYRGRIDNPILQLGEDYARGFSQTPGLIEPRGAYLAGSTYWVPTFDEQLLTYELTVTQPAAWRSVSQGARTQSRQDAGAHVDQWVVETPTEEIYLISAAFTEYSKNVGAVTAMAFLRTPDDTLANTYLETTAQYLEMYRNLVGPYPYSKFALVENFWETGYGMPSFTLLGSEIIRFPFILHSSYPHELLHNWWGNGVFVDFETGNWCEGLTAYMADQLVAEQRGLGADYRRSILQRYTDYVDADTDFPLTQFRSRYNAASEAVGYGKSSMTWDMLRGLVGDEMFVRGFQTFYRDNMFRQAGFDDIRKAFEKVSGRDLKTFFEQWVTRTGALDLELKNPKIASTANGYRLTFTIAQNQAGEPYDVEVPVAVYSRDSVQLHRLPLAAHEKTYTLTLAEAPVRVEVDPQFNLFRTLDPNEVPPSLSKAFGANRILLVLPAAAPPERLARYQALADLWGKDKDKASVVRDDEIETLPADKAVWVLGWDNRFRSTIEAGLEDYDAEIGNGTVRFRSTELSADDNSFVVAVRHPQNPASVVVWLTADRADAVEGLARKLPHYGKYSYLAFTGAEPTNSAKGEWPAVNSPLVAVLSDTASTAELPKRPALAQLAPVFSAEAMAEHVAYLASEELEGRGAGTDGLDKAAEYIAAQFKAMGLDPAGDDGTYFQSFTMKAGDDQREVTVKNVVAVLPGTEADWAGQSVVVSAHYDHLGHGWPGVRAGNEGRIHPGADDNASGVAVMLELAKNLSATKPKRSIVFLATTAEEAGLRGARHYAKHMSRYPVSKAIGNVNLDTVGRLGKNPVYVFGGPSAPEWKFIFMGATAVTGIPTEVATTTVDASDHVAFTEAGVPAVQLFSGGNEDYHRPSDTAGKIDAAGMVKVASIAREAVVYLAEREEPLTFKARDLPSSSDDGPRPSGRSVSTGTMPDFTFNGGGVKVAAVAEGSPAAKAGLKAGDIIVRLGTHEVSDLQAYTKALSEGKPGDVWPVRYLRDGQEFETTITLAKR